MGETLSLSLGIIVSVGAIVGWIFKIWIINPLSAAIDRINTVLDKLQESYQAMAEKNEKTRERVAILERDVKALHHRLDAIVNDIEKLQEQQLECLKERSDHHA